MKTKFITVFLLLSIVLVGCKNENKNDTTASESVVKNDKNFTVTLNVTVKKDDTFSLFYTEDGSTDFTQIQPLWIEVKGSEVPQDVVFALPADASPTQLRLDFGLNKEQQPILINKFNMNFFGKSFESPGKDFYIYFDADRSKTIYDKDQMTIDAVISDGVRQSPSFYPNTKPLGDEIAKLLQ
jgi:hypothetical protein